MSKKLVFAFQIYISFFLLLPNYSLANSHSFKVIVNSSNTIDTIERGFLSGVFFKKIKQWPNGGYVQPVDLGPSSPAREAFSSKVLGRSVLGIKNFWQQLIFSGRDIPPPEFLSEDEVIKYVVKNKNAIGYVSGVEDGREISGYKMIDIK